MDVSKRLHTPRCNLYRRFFEYCLTDYSLSDGEVAELRHLQRLLNLSDADVARIQDRVARDVYGAAIQQVLDDGRLDEDEAVFLRELRADLALPEFRANQMYEEDARRTQQRVLSRVAPSSSFLAPAGATFEIQGASTGDLDGAIRAAIDEAAHALPELSWAELDRVRVQVESGRVVQCSVRMRIGTTEAPES